MIHFARNRRASRLAWLIKQNQAGKAGFSYLLRDLFTTNINPVVTPRACEPGPGTTAFNVAANGYIASSYLCNTAAFFNNDNVARSRVAGLAVYLRDVRRNAKLYPMIYGGWNRTKAATINDEGFKWYQYFISIYEGTALAIDSLPVSPTAELANNYFDGIVSLLPAGSITLFRLAGVDTIPWTIAWVSRANTQSPLYAGESHAFDATNYDAMLKELAVIQLPAPWNTTYGPTLFRSASPVTGDIATGAASLLQYFDWTCAANEVIGISFRRTDDNNRFIIRCHQATSTIKIFKIQAGVETELSTAAKTWTPGTTYKIGVRVWTGPYGQTVYVFDNTSTSYLTAVANIGTFNQTATGCKIGGFATGANWAGYPTTLSGAALAALPT